MIRRLLLFENINEDEARAASLWAEKLGQHDGWVVHYYPSPRPMRILGIDSTTTPGKKRREKVRRLDDLWGNDGQPAKVLRAAIAAQRVVFNVFTGLTTRHDMAFSGTDAVFTVALPDQMAAVSWVARVAGGGPPGIAANCLWAEVRHDATELDWYGLNRDRVRFLFFKRPPRGMEFHHAEVIAYTRKRLAAAPF